MSKDDIQYVLELLYDAINEQDWEIVEEARQYLADFSKETDPKYFDEE